MKTIYYISNIIGILVNSCALADNATNTIPPQHPNFYWGASTNGISAGVYVETVSASSNNIDNLTPIRLHLLLYNSSTNNGNIMPNMIMLLAPPLEDRCKLELRGENGKETERTAKGKALGEKTPKPYKVKPNSDGVIIDTGWRPGKTYLPAGKLQQGLSETLLLSDYFKVQSPGKYHLRCELRLFKPHSDDINEQDLISFPPVNADIEIKNP